jgi:hypothetical protein
MLLGTEDTPKVLLQKAEISETTFGIAPAWECCSRPARLLPELATGNGPLSGRCSSSPKLANFLTRGGFIYERLVQLYCS